jgi:hypothetical protein
VKKSDDIKKQMDDLLVRVEALQNLASKENRDFTPEEQGEWDRIMKSVKKDDGSIDLAKSGELAKLRAEYDKAIAFEEEVARARAARASLTSNPQQVFDNTGAGPAAPPVPMNVRILTPNLVAFKGQGNKEQALRDAYDCGLWFKSLLLRGRHPEAAQAAKDKLIARRGHEWFATQNETTPTDGGYLVPPQFENAVIVYREQVGVSRRLARVVPMTSDTWTTMKQSSGTGVYYPGEEGAITDSDANFSRYSLVAKKRAIGPSVRASGGQGVRCRRRHEHLRWRARRQASH